MIRLDTQGGLSLIFDTWDGEDEVFLTDDEARGLMNELYTYFEDKDREVLAKWLTRKPGDGKL